MWFEKIWAKSSDYKFKRSDLGTSSLIILTFFSINTIFDYYLSKIENIYR
jgi:hypothetical protein